MSDAREIACIEASKAQNARIHRILGLMLNCANDGITPYIYADEEMKDDVSQRSLEPQLGNISVSTDSNESTWDADPVLSTEAEQNGRVERAIPEITKLSLDEANLFDFWDAIITTAEQYHYDGGGQNILVKLVHQLQRTSIGRVSVWGPDHDLFVDLPFFAPSIREAWIDPAYYGEVPTSLDLAKWLNLNSFAARVMHLTNWTVYGTWSFRTALETPSEGRLLEARLVAATEWAIKYPTGVYEECQDEIELDAASMQSVRSGPLYKGAPGLNMERWRFWTQQFRSLGEQFPDKSSIRKKTKIAADMMASMGNVKKV